MGSTSVASKSKKTKKRTRTGTRTRKKASAKTGSRSGTIEQAKSRAGTKESVEVGAGGGRPDRAHLLAAQDELHELAELVALQSPLGRLLQWMEAQQLEARLDERHEPQEAHGLIDPIDESGPRIGRDRVGELLRALPPEKRVSTDAPSGVEPVSEADVMDFRNALEVTNTVLHVRLRRLAALIASS